MKKSRRKLKVLLCSLIACVSMFSFSGCKKGGKLLYTSVTGAAELGQQMGKETAEAFLENEHSKGLIVSIDEWFYNLLSGIIG